MGYIWFVGLTSLVALLFAFSLVIWILKKPEGTDKMREVASFIREGASGYLKQQYKVVSIFFVIIFFILLFMVRKKLLVIFVPFAFLTGGVWSAIAGWVGMYTATRSNSRCTNATKESLNSGLKVALSSGLVMGLTVVGSGLLYLFLWFLFLRRWYVSHPLPPGIDEFTAITSTMLCFGMGASSYALFARVGGGIYTKAADVGADLVGKVEEDLPEDDPRNPAVIADQVGDNVGDVAGMGADLFESYVDSIVATMSLAAVAGLGLRGVFFPMIVAACGIIAAVVGFFFVRIKKETQKDLIFALRRGIIISSLGVVGLSLFFIYYYLGGDFLGVWLAIICGLLSGIFLGVATEYFTSASFSPTKVLAQSSLTGPATVIIGGLSLGMLSTILPILFICGAVILSFYLAGGGTDYNLGLYGIGIASVGLLSTLGITLASDAYGPVADNAGGIAEMSGLGREVRARCDQLDALGNTTAATGKGFAIGSAALTALALIVAYKERVQILGKPLDLSLLNVRLLVGLFLGGMIPFIFSSLTLRAVGLTAEIIVKEVRRQFKEIVGLREGKARADYASCVRITTQAAQKRMVLPSLLAIISPILVGLLLGVEAVCGFLIGALVSGFVLAVMMANSGGAWDNAKKYIEEGNLGGKGSFSHKAAVVGDTVGDPFKDTAGPSLNILLKLMSMVAIVFSQFMITYSLFQ
jgi:K(+)-stimulated pyrophosphate-energized sodium pump